jgi:uncharacterized protein YqeY
MFRTAWLPQDDRPWEKARMSDPEQHIGDPVQALRGRASADLKLAMRARDAAEIAALRSLLGALDNAGAVATAPRNEPVYGRSADVPRRVLSAAEVEALLTAEIAEREAALASYEGGGQHDAAARLRAEVKVLVRYRPDAS